MLSINFNKFALAIFFIFALIFTQIVYSFRSKADALVPYTHELISVDSSGNPGNNTSGWNEGIDISGNGRYVVFSSNSSNLVPNDTNGKEDIFIRDRYTNTTSRVSVTTSGGQLLGDSKTPQISIDGKIVVFYSESNPNTGSFTSAQVLIRDLENGTTNYISMNNSGVKSNSTTTEFSMSEDGRYVSFTTSGSNIVTGDTNGSTDIFVRDTKLNTTSLISKSSSNTIGNVGSYKSNISCDGTKIAFYSNASNLIASDTNGLGDMFIVDRMGGHNVTNITSSATSSYDYRPMGFLAIIRN